MSGRGPAGRSQGWLRAGSWSVPVALGRGGIKANKREGDGGTPRGRVPAATAVVAAGSADAGRAPRCRPAGSTAPMPGAKIPQTGATTVRFGGRPMNQAIGFGATTASTT